MTYLDELQAKEEQLNKVKFSAHGEIYSNLLKLGFDEAQQFSEYVQNWSDYSFNQYKQGMEKGKEIYNK